jgi:hypothetical protein
MVISDYCVYNTFRVMNGQGAGLSMNILVSYPSHGFEIQGK